MAAAEGGFDVMRNTRFAIAFCSTVLALGACGGGQHGITTGAMPEGGTFHGVWHSPQYGEMHFCQSGDRVIGEYTKDERNGQVQGSVDGDVLFFDWTEDRELVTGRPSTTTGHGYFRLRFEEDGRYYLDGEWGLHDEYRGGGLWRAVKLERRQPDECYASVRQAPEGLDALPDDSGDTADGAAADEL
jgi:hypothetical protein